MFSSKSRWVFWAGRLLIGERQALDEEDRLLGVVICKLEPHSSCPLRGYIAMLVVLKEFRGNGIATQLVKMAIDAMIAKDAYEVCLESFFEMGSS